jgi:RHH-type proline utilization regulon transcriptional repressor/proline dehydrogenase/delta 1-pyrroline-5-carboxylate dehydrogenase
MAWFSKKSGPLPTQERPPVHSDSIQSLQIDPEVNRIGLELLDLARAGKAGIFSSKFYSDKMMNWSMKDQEFKVQLFRFVDVFPMLQTPEQVFEHLADYLSQPGVTLPPGMDLGLKAGGIAKGIMTKTISSQIKGMAGKFIAGTDAKSALPRLKQLWDNDIGFSVDLLGEACVSDAEADEYKEKYLDLINNLPGEVSEWKANTQIETDHLGPIPRSNVSIKVSSLSAKVDPIDTEGSIRELMTRLDPILEAAIAKGVFINFDMEQFELKDLTIELFKRCCMKHDFHAGIAIQAYLKSGPDDARDLARWAIENKRQVSVRLIKGAYWDFETIHAEEMGWPCPVWNEKWQTDACFEDMVDIFLDAMPRTTEQGGIKLALGSHNIRSIAYAMAGLDKRGLPSNSLELQMLHGMADEMKYAAADNKNGPGLRIREYIPVGEMIPGMAYLVRRLLENTSNESWLVAGFAENADPQLLLADPRSLDSGSPKPDLVELAHERHKLSPAVYGVGNNERFFTEAVRDFAMADQRDAFSAALDRTAVGAVDNDKASEADATKAIDTAEAAFKQWRRTDPVMRANVLTYAANLMRARRDELSSIMVKEAGKSWREADGDVCEAIDFCEYYARMAPQLFERQRLGMFIGELDEHFYQPRGVSVVISPWNFPLAICCGMTAAALVTGNTVVVKPAEQTPHIASEMVKIFHEAINAGMWQVEFNASEVLQFLPGRGETVGATLVRDPRTSVIAFTGSKAVGLNIIEAAGLTPDHQMQVKKVVCEMGGKNALIIDTSADLDEAVIGARASAFGFQGQKCSACSRCIIVDSEGPTGAHITRFTERLVEATRALVVAGPDSPSCDVGPVIDDEAANKIRSMIETGVADGATLALSDKDFPAIEPSPGVAPKNYIPPHIFTGVTPEHRIAREEIFGPVLAVMHAHTYEEALAIANNHAYKLTGGVFSRMPKHIEQAKQDFRVGNLYINRTITGALVGRQPFGGFGLSGVGSKAGGQDYLLQFVEPRAICENTMRRGFAPEL